jgi:hypothetical protein
MAYSLTHYLRNVPFKFYLSGGLIRTDDPTISLFLSAKYSTALISRRHHAIGLESDISGLSDAPPILGESNEMNVGNRNFTVKLLSRFRAKGSPRFIFIPEFGVNDLYCNIHASANLRETNVESLLESLREEPRQVIGSWDDPREFRWSIMNSKLEVMAGNIERMTEQVTIVGLPNDYCEQVELWVESQRGTLLAMVPVPVACLKWFSEMIPQSEGTAFLILFLANSVLLAVVQLQEIILLRQYVEDAFVAYQEIPVLAEELRVDRYQVYVWSPERISEERGKNLKGTELTGEALRQIHGQPVQIRRLDGSRSETNESVPHLLHWMEGLIA